MTSGRGLGLGTEAGRRPATCLRVSLREDAAGEPRPGGRGPARGDLAQGRDDHDVVLELAELLLELLAPAHAPPRGPAHRRLRALGRVAPPPGRLAGAVERR